MRGFHPQEGIPITPYSNMNLENFSIAGEERVLLDLSLK